jgi:hypothetical protein
MYRSKSFIFSTYARKNDEMRGFHFKKRQLRPGMPDDKQTGVKMKK